MVESASDNAMALRCRGCHKVFDLIKRLPLIQSCCLDTSCQECWYRAFNDQGEFICPYQCGQKNVENPQEFRYNMQIKRSLELQPNPSYIMCDTHPLESVSLYDTHLK
ncbi:hypothetical protein FGO68_gene11908 [Halteria grandinella]|uniref:Uncharacterized protein n=1 Tax=Halteria grandinella TaxID=5974 RepID=A0A8J8NDM8_HALGN|nr:hypothetical protein FGO68_gene11908 [Halteria grandinella]